MTELPADIAAARDILLDETRQGMLGVNELEDCEAARAALDAAILKHLRGGWRPISTAPKDGSWILVYERLDYGPNQYRPDMHVAHWGLPGCPHPGESETWVTMTVANDYVHYADKATHWRPLPAPPALADTPDAGTDVGSDQI